jgi:hypothetical protein
MATKPKNQWSLTELADDAATKLRGSGIRVRIDADQLADILWLASLTMKRARAELVSWAGKDSILVRQQDEREKPLRWIAQDLLDIHKKRRGIGGRKITWKD